MFPQHADEITFDVFLQRMLVVPLPIGDDLLVKSVLDTESFPPLSGLDALYHVCPVDVELVKFSVNVGYIQ